MPGTEAELKLKPCPQVGEESDSQLCPQEARPQGVSRALEKQGKVREEAPFELGLGMAGIGPSRWGREGERNYGDRSDLGGALSGRKQPPLGAGVLCQESLSSTPAPCPTFPVKPLLPEGKEDR